jgi:PAS domain S-box-containing protein
MSATGQKHSPDSDMRQRAEEQLSRAAAGARSLPADPQSVLHELQVHQIELQMQNEELRAAQLELEASSARYSDLFDFAPVGYVVLDLDGVILAANLTAAALLGIERSALLKRRLSHFVLPEDQDIFHVHRQRLGADSGRQTCELRLRKADGQHFFARLETTPMPDRAGNRQGCRIAVVDITDRKLAEDALARRTRELETLMDHAPDIIVRFDRESRPVYANRRWADLAGVPLEQAPGQRCGDIGLPLDLEVALAEAFTTGQMQEPELRLARAYEHRYFQAKIVPELTPDGTAETALAIIRDVTEQRRLQNELNQAHKMEVAGQLAAGIAHDVNNMLTAIAGYAALLRTELPAHGESSLHLGQIEEATQAAGTITKALLAFTHRMPAEQQPVEVRTAIGGTARLLRRMLPAAIEVVVDVPTETGLWVLCGRMQLQQIILNMAINARHAMPNGGTLRIAVSEEGAAPGATQPAPGADSPAGVRIVISDTGCGISPGVLPHIFEPFFTTKAAGQGTGLGLSVVKSVIEEHGGRISVESDVGQGTTFTIRLPRAAPVGLTAGEQEVRESARGHGELVVVAEDNRQVLQVLTTGLQRAGYEVGQVTDAQELLAQCARWQQKVRLLVVDIDLPKGDGIQALRQIRRTAPTMPAIVITAKIEFDLETVTDEHTRALRKPFRLGDFLRVVAELSAKPQDTELAQ